VPTADTAGTGTGGAGTAGTSDEAQASGTAAAGTGSNAGATGNLQQQVNALRSEVQTLQAQVAAQQQQDADMRERADTLEQQRQVRLDEIERARQWLIAADKALEAGELDIGDALREADAALENVVQSATDAGSGQTVLLVEDARTRMAQALASTGNRDTYKARWDLFFAYERLRDARRQNLDEASATTVTR
jgi:chromosome segregation ATPase